MNFINIFIRILIISLIFSSANVFARMYQWVEPDTGITQLSGKPPAWYRSAAGGARVFVFDNGRLIDDTSVKVSDEVRQRMRQQAFILAEEDRKKAKEKIAKSQELKQKYKKAESNISEQTSPQDLEEVSKADLETEEQIADENLSKEQNYNDDSVEKSLDEFRELIKKWEKSKTESARESVKKVLE